MSANFETIIFKYGTFDYVETSSGVRERKEEVKSTSTIATFALFEDVANSHFIRGPASIDQERIAWILRGSSLHNRSFFDVIKDFFSFLGYESSMQKADRLYYAVLMLRYEVESEEKKESEIDVKLSSSTTVKEALPLIMKLKQDEIAEPFKAYFYACLKYGHDDLAREALDKCYVSFKLASAEILPELEAKYNEWKAK